MSDAKQNNQANLELHAEAIRALMAEYGIDEERASRFVKEHYEDLERYQDPKFLESVLAHYRGTSVAEK